jgi:hypothetical protein
MAKFFQALSFNGIPEWEFLNHKILIKDNAHADAVLEMLICLDFWQMKNVCPACQILQDDLLEHFMIAHVGVSFYEVSNDRESAVSALLQEDKAELVPNCWRCYDCGKVTYATNPQCDCQTGYYQAYLRHLRCPICVQLIRVERYYAHYKYCWDHEYLSDPDLCKLCCSYDQYKCAEIVYNAMKYVANRMNFSAVLCPGCWQTAHISDYRSHFIKCFSLRNVNEISVTQICEKWKLSCVTSVNELGKIKDWNKTRIRRIEPVIKCWVCPATFANNANLFLHFFTHRSQPFAWEQLIEKAINLDSNLANLLLNMDVEQINRLMLEPNSITFKAPATFKPAVDSITFNTPNSITFKAPAVDSITFNTPNSITFKAPAVDSITFKAPATQLTEHKAIGDRKDLELSNITFKQPEKKKVILASDIPGDELEEL